MVIDVYESLFCFSFIFMFFGGGSGSNRNLKRLPVVLFWITGISHSAGSNAVNNLSQVSQHVVPRRSFCTSKPPSCCNQGFCGSYGPLSRLYTISYFTWHLEYEGILQLDLDDCHLYIWLQRRYLNPDLPQKSWEIWSFMNATPERIEDNIRSDVENSTSTASQKRRCKVHTPMKFIYIYDLGRIDG